MSKRERQAVGEPKHFCRQTPHAGRLLCEPAFFKSLGETTEVGHQSHLTDEEIGSERISNVPKVTGPGHRLGLSVPFQSSATCHR